MDNSLTFQHEALQPVVYELGVTVYFAQQFETSLLLLTSLLEANNGVVTADSFTQNVDLYKKKKQTLGQLAGKFKSKLSLPDAYEKYIRQGVDARNMVIHGFVVRHHTNFQTVEGRATIIAELRDAQYIINERLKSLNEILDRALQIFGGSLEQLRQETNFCFEPDSIDEITRH